MKSLFKNRIALFLSALILLILLASAVACWFLIVKGKTGTTAEIYQDGKRIQTIRLDTVTKTYTFRVSGEGDVYNIIEVRPGEIGIIEASCPDGLCIHTGFIHSAGIPITCLPNRLVIKITGDDANSQSVDQVAY